MVPSQTITAVKYFKPRTRVGTSYLVNAGHMIHVHAALVEIERPADALVPVRAYRLTQVIVIGKKKAACAA